MKQQAFGAYSRSSGIAMGLAIFLAILLGGYFYIGISLQKPLYTRWIVNDILKTTVADKETMKLGPKEIQQRIFKRISINNVYGFDQKEIKVKQTEKHIEIIMDKSIDVKFPGELVVTTLLQKKIKVPRP